MATRRHVLWLGAAGALAATAPLCAQERIKVVASFSILGDFVRNVGGDRIELRTLVGPNSDTHVFSPTPADAAAVRAARIVFVNGLGFDAWMSRLARASGGTAPIIVASDGIKTRRMQSDRHDRMVIDPHGWQSVANARIYIANIRDGLGRVDPAGQALYEANASTYLAKLDALERDVKSAIERIPAVRRKVITTHDAFGYFGDAYGISFIAPEGVSTDAEPSARDVARIISQVRTNRIPAVFMENITDPRTMQQIARETGARIGGTLYSDALSDSNGPAATYIDMIRHNVREIVRALM